MKKITVHVRAPSKTSRLLTFDRIPELKNGDALELGFAIDGNALALEIVADSQVPGWASAYSGGPFTDGGQRGAKYDFFTGSPAEMRSLFEVLAQTEAWLVKLLAEKGYEVTFD